MKKVPSVETVETILTKVDGSPFSYFIISNHFGHRCPIIDCYCEDNQLETILTDLGPVQVAKCLDCNTRFFKGTKWLNIPDEILLKNESGSNDCPNCGKFPREDSFTGTIQAERGPAKIRANFQYCTSCKKIYQTY